VLGIGFHRIALCPSVPLLEADCHKGVGNLDEHPLIKIREEVDLPQHVQFLLLLTCVVVCKHVVEGALVNLPEFAGGVGDAGHGAGAVVHERELSKGWPPGADPHMIAVNNEGDAAILNHVEIIPNPPLVDDGRAGRMLLAFMASMRRRRSSRVREVKIKLSARELSMNCTAMPDFG
jgi:hypothetical protein